jgi:hypothetical protein
MNIQRNIELLPTKDSYVFKVKLMLQYESRFIGELNTSGEGTFTTKRKNSQLFRKLNALGINHELLTNESIPFKWIVIKYEGQRLITSRKYFLAKGKQYQFGKKGFEPLFFLPLDEFGVEKARAFERNYGEQLSFIFND